MYFHVNEKQLTFQYFHWKKKRKIIRQKFWLSNTYSKVRAF